MADNTGTLADVAVAVYADLTPLMAGLDRAKAAIQSFDASMVKGSSGLLEVAKSSKAVGDAATIETQKLVETAKASDTATAAAEKLTAANKQAAESSKQATAAAETEAAARKRIADMVNSSIARMNQMNRPTATGAIAAGMANGGVWDRDLFAAQNAVMGATTVPKTFLNGSAAVKDAEAATKAIKGEAEAAGDLAAKAALSSTSIREMIVLLREAGRGDFTRMAGSASILAQRMGLLEAAGGATVLTFGALAAAAALVGGAWIKASIEATEFQNALRITGNYAGLTASSYEEMAKQIAHSTGTSVSSNKEMISSLAGTNSFTKNEIESLISSAQLLAKATGQSAEDIVKDFAKMAEGPTHYAEEFHRVHAGILTPLQIDYIRQLEARGQKEKALEVLIEDVNAGIAENTVKNTNIMVRAWDFTIRTISNGWENLKGIFREQTAQEQIQSLTVQITKLDGVLNNSWNNAIPGYRKANEDLYKSLVNQRAALQESINGNEKAAKAQSDKTAADNRQSDALKKISDDYSKATDSQRRFKDDVQVLNNTLADATRMARGSSVASLLAAAAKSASPEVRELGNTYAAQVDKIRKSDLPAAFAADAKAAREAESAAKKAAEAAKRLEERRQSEITNLREETSTLEKVVPLYQDQTLTLDEVNRAKAITVALTKLKLDADSAEGRTVANLVGHIHDLNKAIEDEGKKRQILDGIVAKTETLETETALVGKSAGALEEQKSILEGLTKAKRDHIIVDDRFLENLKKDAAELGRQTDINAKAKFSFDNSEAFQKQIDGLKQQQVALNLSKNEGYAYAYMIDKINEATAKHIALMPQDIIALRKQAEQFANTSTELDNMRARYEAANFASNALETSFEDAILNGKSLIDVLHGLVGAFAKAALEATLFGNGPLANIMGTGETGRGSGGLVGGIFTRWASKTSDSSSALAAQGMNQVGTAALKAAAALNALGSTGVTPLAASTDMATQALDKQIPVVGQFGNSLLSIFSTLAQGGGGGIGSFLQMGLGLVGGALGGGGLSGVNLGGLSGIESGLESSIAGNMGSFAMPIPAFADGGMLGGVSRKKGILAGPGTGKSDDILHWGSAGEFITNADATKKFLPILEGINSGRLPNIGSLSSMFAPTMQAGSSISFGDIHVSGVEDDRQARRVGRQLSATLQTEMSAAVRKGFGGPK